MKNLFDKTVIEELSARITALDPNQQPQWGQMGVAQMLAHCSEVLKNALGDGQQKRMWIGYVVAPFIRHRYYDNQPFKKKNVPSSFIVNTNKDFVEERQKLISLIEHFYQAGKEKSKHATHPMLGQFMPEQWAIGQYKHLDHHLRQFGV